jgi:uncharacterized protein
VVQLETTELVSQDGLPLRLEIRRPTDATPRASVIVCHGFKGFKSWGFFPYVAERLAREGYEVVTFDFSRNGIGDDPLEFTRLDLFAQNTYSCELADLQTITRWVQASGDPWTQRLGLAGHSRGAVPVMVEARENEAVRAIATWSGVGHLLRFTQRQLAQWKEIGHMEFTNARTGQLMAMDYAFVQDALDHADRLDLAAAAANMPAAHLIVHAGADQAVDPGEAETLRAGRHERCEVAILEGASHTFDAKHPFESAPKALDAALDRTLVWFDRYLMGPPESSAPGS